MAKDGILKGIISDEAYDAIRAILNDKERLKNGINTDMISKIAGEALDIIVKDTDEADGLGDRKIEKTTLLARIGQFINKSIGFDLFKGAEELQQWANTVETTKSGGKEYVSNAAFSEKLHQMVDPTIAKFPSDHSGNQNLGAMQPPPSNEPSTSRAVTH